jgi:predicted phage terminase large subunit-like protein
MNSEHDELCKFLISKGLYKLILMPRFTFKSCIVTVGYTLWRLAKDYNLRLLIYSDAASKAEGFLGSITNHITGKVAGSKFREIFGHWEVDPKKDKWNQSQIVIGFRQTAYAEPSIDTGGIETSKIGFHYPLIIFDDIVSDKNVTTKAQMDKVADCYKKALSLLVPGGEIIMVGTRWHFGDLYGRLLAENAENRLFETFIRKAYDGEKYYFADIGECSLTKERLALLKKQQGSYVFSCNPAEAPIIMGDWTAKSICDIEEGDEIIGWKRKSTNEKQLITSKVLKVQSRMAEVVKIKLKSGREIRCTSDHNWFTGRNDETHREYRPAKVGMKLMYMFKPYISELCQSDQKLASWLGGFYDGEGSCSDSIILNQSKEKNPEVCLKLEATLNVLNYTWNSAEKEPTKTAWGGKTTYYWVNGGIQEKRRFLLQCNPSRRSGIENSIFKHGCRFIKEKDEIVSIKPDGFEKVYALQTETGNYIAWGYGSKNCLYQNSPVDDETATFKARDFSFAEVSPTDLYITATIDPAGKGEDYTAITVVGTDHQLTMYLLEIVNQKMTPSEMIEKIVSLNYKYKFKMFGIETNFFRGMLKLELERRIQTEHQENPEKFPLFGTHEFLAASRRGESKHSRIRGLQPYHERGSIKFPGKQLELLEGTFSELAYQMLQFPNAAHDDILDSLAYHIPLVRAGGVAKKKEVPYMSPAWIELEAYRQEMKTRNRLPRRARGFVAPLSLS